MGNVLRWRTAKCGYKAKVILKRMGKEIKFLRSGLELRVNNSKGE